MLILDAWRSELAGQLGSTPIGVPLSPGDGIGTYRSRLISILLEFCFRRFDVGAGDESERVRGVLRASRGVVRVPGLRGY